MSLTMVANDAAGGTIELTKDNGNIHIKRIKADGVTVDFELNGDAMYLRRLQNVIQSVLTAIPQVTDYIQE